MNEIHKFRALYYPYSRCFHLTDLKRALLIFDEILFVDPLSKDISEHPGQYPLFNPQIQVRSLLENPNSRGTSLIEKMHPNQFDLMKWYDVSETYKKLQKKGIVKLVDPLATLIKHQETQSYSILNDIFQGVPDEMGIMLHPSSSHNYFGWRLHSSRIPNLLYELLSSKEILQYCVSKMEVSQERKERLMFELERDLVERPMRKPDGDIAIFDFSMALALILNQALLLCEDYQAYPLTDDPMAHAALIRKISIQYNTSPVGKYIIPKPTAPDLDRIQSFTLAVVSRLIPDDMLESLEIEEVLEFQNNNSEPLQLFRMKMLELAAEITTKPWDIDFQSQVLNQIESKVMPEIQKLDYQLKDSYHDLFGSFAGKIGSELGKVVAPAIPTMTLAAFMGLSFNQVVLFGAASMMSGLGLVLPDVIEYQKEKRELKRNGLLYLLKFRKNLRPDFY